MSFIKHQYDYSRTFNCKQITEQAAQSTPIRAHFMVYTYKLIPMHCYNYIQFGNKLYTMTKKSILNIHPHPNPRMLKFKIPIHGYAKSDI